jgi:hypothetical protein
MSKLTLHVPENLVIAAKQEAATRGTSVSKLVSDYFRILAGGHCECDATPTPPTTAALIGCLQEANYDRKSYIDYLEKKHS